MLVLYSGFFYGGAFMQVNTQGSFWWLFYASPVKQTDFG